MLLVFFSCTLVIPYVHAVKTPELHKFTWDEKVHILKAEAKNLDDTGPPSYYIEIIDPNGDVQGTSPTYSAVNKFDYEIVVTPDMVYILGTWTAKLFQVGTPDVLKDTKTVEIEKVVWTTDSSYNTKVTVYTQCQTVYYKAIGLDDTKYYKVYFKKGGTTIWDDDPVLWTGPGITELYGSYPLTESFDVGEWTLHTRYADNEEGSDNSHYVDCKFEVVPCLKIPEFPLGTISVVMAAVFALALFARTRTKIIHI